MESPFCFASLVVVHMSHTGSIDRHRLFSEDVFAGLDRSAQLQRSEMGRCGQQNYIEITAENLLVGIKSDEPVILVDADSGSDVGLPSHRPQTRIDPILKGIRHRDQLGIHIGVQRLDGRPSTAASAADQTEPDRVAARRMHRSSRTGDDDRRTGRHGRDRLIEKATPRRRSLAIGRSVQLRTWHLQSS